MAIAKVSVNQVASMNVPEDVLLLAMELALINVLPHVVKRVAQVVKDFVL